MALYVGPMLEVRAHLSETPEDTDQGTQAAGQLLQRAGNAVGGGERLRAIERLHITAVERQRWGQEVARGRSFKLWLPDRFQSHVEGFATHTLNGGRLTIDREVLPETRRSAEVAIPAMFRRVALAFVLRAPGMSVSRLHGETTIAGPRGILVEFTATDGRNLKLVLAATSAHPLAIIYPVRDSRSNQQLPDRVWRLEDYRVVDGIRFPFRLTLVRPGREIVTEVQEIKVNPSFTLADFPK
jgi:hypothetical protein